jgi:acyl-CoA thioesterase FadM
VHEDEYTLIEDVEGPVKDDPGHHLVDYETGKLISNLWSIYLAKAREGTSPGPSPALRRTTNDFLTEGYAGQKFQRGIRMVSRTRRGCTFQAGLWHADDGRMIQTAEIVTVFVDMAAGKAAEIPDDFWANVEALEGRTIPVTERTA